MRSGALAIIAALVLAACSGDSPASPTPGPTSQPTATLVASPSDSASATPAVATPTPGLPATAPPTVAPTPGPTAVPTPTYRPSPTPAPTANPHGWVEIGAFPTYGPDTHVAAVTYGAGTFVAVGWSRRNGNTRGRVWTSANGVAWTAQPDSLFSGRELAAVAYDGTAFLAFGTGSTTVYRSPDGAAWAELANMPPNNCGELGCYNMFDGSYVADATAVGATVYAAGGSLLAGGDIECNCVDVWRYNNAAWASSVVDPDDTFQALAAMPGLTLVITYGSYIGRGLFYSANFSDWSTPDLGITESDEIGFLDAASDGQRIVAVGYGGDEYSNAVALVTDGSTWTVNTFDATSRAPAEQLSWAAGRFVAVGRVTWWSTDGAAWQRGPDVPYPPADPVPPEAGDDPFTHRTIGAGQPGVVLAQTYDEGLHVWFAPMTAFGG